MPVLARSTTARTRTTGRSWFPADFITESFPGQFRNWFYSMLAMSTVLRREAPFKTIFGYATLFGEDGRPMHKSWGNAIEFDEAADRMGVDVMRWMFASARPEDNILFGWHAADEARRELLVLWNVYAFFVTYARLAGWTPGDAGAPPPAERARARPLDPVADGRPRGRGSRTGSRLRRARRATRAIDAAIDDLSTWYLRRSRRRFSRSDDAADRAAAFATLHARARRRSPGSLAPILPFLSEAIYQNLVAAADPAAPDSVHLTRWPTAELAGLRDAAARGGDGDRPARRRAGPDAARRRPGSRSASRSPGCGSPCPAASSLERDALLALVADEVNVSAVELIGDESELVERRVKPLLPEDRQEARRGDPGGHGRGPGRRVRDPARRLGGARRA